MTPTFSNVAYGTKPLERLDVYLAPSPTPTAAVIEFHPGGWGGGIKSDFSKYHGAIEKIYQKGISVISINYPLAPQDPYPTANLSVQRAIQFVRARAAQWNIDKNRIAAIGRSAGAQLALWAAMSPDAAVPGAGGLLQQSSRLRAVVSIEGPTDFTDPYYKYDAAVTPGISPAWQYFGASTQAQWDAIPIATKLSASPRWLASQSAAVLNRDVSFLAIHPGNPLATSTADLVAPAFDLHDLYFGMAMVEALGAIGNIDASLWAAPSLTSLSGDFLAGETIAEWLQQRLLTTKITQGGFGTPGCYGPQFLTAPGVPALGNAQFTVRAQLSLFNSKALLVCEPAPAIAAPAADPLGLGLRWLLDPLSPQLFVYDGVADGFGTVMFSTPIPADPALSGNSYILQAVTAWQGPGTPIGCVPSPLKLSTTNALRVVVE